MWYNLTMHGITCPEQPSVKLGLTPTTEVIFEGMNVQALLDTGSPITLVSAKFLFQALAKHHLPDQLQTIAKWEDSVKERLKYSNVKLKDNKSCDANSKGGTSTTAHWPWGSLPFERNKNGSESDTV